MIKFSNDHPTTDEIREALSGDIAGVRHFFKEKSVELVGYESDKETAVDELEAAGFAPQILE